MYMKRVPITASNDSAGKSRSKIFPFLTATFFRFISATLPLEISNIPSALSTATISTPVAAIRTVFRPVPLHNSSIRRPGRAPVKSRSNSASSSA